jgi:dihydrofolate synthase/folylpolyglutamate synthase
MQDSIDTNSMRSPIPEERLDYEDALRLVMSLADFERSSHSPDHSSFHLERIGLLMEHLGNPHLDVPTVHVAGTKGKGSTAAMIASILTSAGHKVGLYTSPHLHSAVERIRVDLEPIERGDFASLVVQVWPQVEKVSKEGGYGGVSTFEMLTAMAFLHFKQIEADFQVIEVGLGGRLDSTNIVAPQVCVITSISLDHVSTLGDTVELIAAEKAGIIKPGVPAVVAPQQNGALSVVRKVADRVGAPVVDVQESVSFRDHKADVTGQALGLSGLRDSYQVWTPLLGDHQVENLRTAVAAVEKLIDSGATVPHDAIVRGLREVRWPARLEVLSQGDHWVLADGAHNPYSMQRLTQALRDLFKYRRLVVVFGALGGHSAEGMLSELAGMSPLLLATQSRHPRSAPSDAISDIASKEGIDVVFASSDVGEATRRAREIARPGDVVLGTGSLSVAAEVIEEIKGISPELYPGIKRPVPKNG